MNPKETEVQGIKCYAKVEELPQVDCAIIAIAAKYCPSTVDTLALEKGQKDLSSSLPDLEKRVQKVLNMNVI